MQLKDQCLKMMLMDWLGLDILKTASQLQVTNDTIISCGGYVSLLYSATNTYNTQFTTRTNAKVQKRTVYQHETTSYENNEEYEHYVDTNIEYLVINFTNIHLENRHTLAYALPHPNGMRYRLNHNKHGIN